MVLGLITIITLNYNLKFNYYCYSSYYVLNKQDKMQCLIA